MTFQAPTPQLKRANTNPWRAQMGRIHGSSPSAFADKNRTVPGAADVIGVSLATNTVTVNGLVPYRKGEYFCKELTVANSSAPVWQAVTMAANGQTSVRGNVLVPKATESFWQDADGNLLCDSLWTNTWNGENRLITLESAVGVPTGAKMREAWKHLPDGRWIERVVSTNNGSAYYPAYRNRFVWDGQVLLAILDRNNGLVMSFVRGLDLSGSVQGAGGVGGVVAVAFKTNGIHFVSYDGNGNVAALTDSGSGTNSATYEYGPFSEPIRVTGLLANQMPLRFSTMYEDNVTGNREYLFRDYSPSTGRWKNRDPIEEEEAIGNLFDFVHNYPSGQLDAFGLKAITLWVGFDSSVTMKLSKKRIFEKERDSLMHMLLQCKKLKDCECPELRDDLPSLNLFFDNQRNKTAPSGGVYDILDGLSLINENLGKIEIPDAPQPTVRVLGTSCALYSPGRLSKGHTVTAGILYNVGYASGTFYNILAHELGHVAKYNRPDNPDDHAHAPNSEWKNLMNHTEAILNAVKGFIEHVASNLDCRALG